MGIISCMTSSWSSLINSISNLTTLQKFGTFIITATAVYVYIRKRRKCSEPPGPIGYPCAARLPLTGKKSHIVLMELRQEHGDIYQIDMGSIPTVVVNGGLIHEVLGQHGEAFSSRPRLNRETKTKNSSSILTFGEYDGAWQIHRNIATDVVASYVKSEFSKIETIVSDAVDNVVMEFRIRGYGSFNPSNDIRKMVAGIGFQICYGKRKHVQTDNDFLEYMHMNGKPSNGKPSIDLRSPKRADLKKLLKDIEIKRNQLIKEHIETFKEERTRDLLDGLIRSTKDVDGQNLPANVSRGRILGTVADFFAGGLDTVNAVIMWAILIFGSRTIATRTIATRTITTGQLPPGQ